MKEGEGRVEKERFGYEGYLSVFTWRYGSREMRRIFSEENYRILWRRIWLSLAEEQAKYGLITPEELEDLRGKAGPENIDIARAHEWERMIKHDLMAEIKTFAEQAPLGGGKLHMGATSKDILDNADALRVKEALDLILTRLINCLEAFSKIIEEHKETFCIGWTHLQPAVPTTLGYRFANYTQDLVLDIHLLEELLSNLRGKGLKGAVGTSASFQRLLKGKGEAMDLERAVMERLGIGAYPVTTQFYPRKQDFLLLTVLASIAQSLHKLGVDLRHLQSPAIGEVSEPIGIEQVGSSTMPFKKNPVKAERMCSLARYVSRLPLIAWENGAEMILEGSLDGSANRRIIIPEAFLAIDEGLILCDGILRGLRVFPAIIKKNLERFAPFSATEAILMALVERGADRQVMHERLRSHSFKAWERVMAGEENPLPRYLREDPLIASYIPEEELFNLLDVKYYIGDAPRRCELFLEEYVKPLLSKYRGRLGGRVGIEF